MRFFKKIIELGKKAIKFFKELFKDKSAAEVINDVSKTVVAVSTIGLTVYAGINAIRVRFMKPSKSRNNGEVKSGHDYVAEMRKDGRSISEKIAENRRLTANLGKKRSAITNMNREDLELLEMIALRRNNIFRSLSPEDQMNVLKMEGFDFEAFRREEKNRHRRPLFPWGEKFKKLGKSPEDKPFREPVDFGFLNFIMRPIDNFMHWVKNDPVPKKCPQIELFDRNEIPNIKADNPEHAVAILHKLDSYFNRNNSVEYSENEMFDPAKAKEEEICVQEIFKHKSLKKFRKAVDKRMAMTEFGTQNPLSIFDDEALSTKKKKKKKSGKKKKNYDEDLDFVNGDSKKKKKKKDKKSGKKKNREDEEMVARAERRAKDLYRYHLENAMKDEYDLKGFSFKF